MNPSIMSFGSTAVPVLRGSTFSPSNQKLNTTSTSQQRSTFHLSNLIHTLSKFGKNLTTTNKSNPFLRATSSNANDSLSKITRRSFSKHDTPSPILRPSSCFVLDSPSRQSHQPPCLFFQKVLHQSSSPKTIPSSSFTKLKRVSSYLLPIKRKQSFSLLDRSFKVKETGKRRSRLLNYTLFKSKTKINSTILLPSGTFGYRRRSNKIPIESIRRSIPFSHTRIDLLLESRLFSYFDEIYYETISTNSLSWSTILFIKPFHGVILDGQTLILFQPKLFDNDDGRIKTNDDKQFIYIPFYSTNCEENHFLMGYSPRSSSTIRIPVCWISKNVSDNEQISTKFTLRLPRRLIPNESNNQNGMFTHDNHHQRSLLVGNASLISEALRHYQRLERQNDGERIIPAARKSDKHHRRHQQQHGKESKFRPIAVEQAVVTQQQESKSNHHYFDPIQLRRKQCSSTLIDEDIPVLTNRNLNCFTSSSSSSGFRSHSRSSSIQTSSLVGCIGGIEVPVYAEAIHAHVTLESSKLPFDVGDQILILNKTANLWYGRNGINQEGWFPSSDVRIKVCQDSLIKQSNDQPSMNKRGNVVREIYKTEHDYIGHLRNLVEGYVKKMRLCSDLFTNKQIELLMGNIEEIFQFQQEFFQLLKLSIDENQPHESLIGKCFLLYKEEFKKYSDYCINHPLSCIELNKLEANVLYRNFFETCRLQANMIELRLDGFLLSPIQRICQYPLQLNELLKYTPIDHKDHNNVEQALNTMRDVAVFINERKRRMEYVEVIHKWQHTVENWQGKNLLETSTQGLGRADAYLHQHNKKEPVTLFLFDHVLIICRKDRRNTLVYIGRADLDNAEIEDLIDGNVSRLDEENLVHRLFAWRLYDRNQEKTFLFAHRTLLDKIQMMDALDYERAHVEENLSKGLEIPLYTRLATLKTQQYLSEQPSTLFRSMTTTSFPLITKPNRSISAILRTSNSQYHNQSSLSTSSAVAAADHPPLSRRRFVPSRKSSLPRFVRCSSRDSSIDDGLRSVKSRFRFWS